jgi:hypothetical protein
MAHFDDSIDDIQRVRSKARMTGHIRRAQMMVMVAGLTAFGIVAIAGAMMMTLL